MVHISSSVSKGISSLGPAGCHPLHCSGRKTNQTQKEKRKKCPFGIPTGGENIEHFVGADAKSAAGLTLPKKANTAIKGLWFVV